MKKLLATSAIVALSLASAPALAQTAMTDLQENRLTDNDFDLQVNGYIDTALIFGAPDNGLAYTKTNGDAVNAIAYSGLSHWWDGEFVFNLSKTLDSGLEVGATGQLGISGSGAFDEASVYLSGGFGEVRLGAEDPVSDTMGIGVPSAVHFSENPVVAIDGGHHDNAEVSADSNKIIYKSPRFAGVQAGVSYAPVVDQELSYQQGSKDQAAISVAVNYSGDFDVVTVDAAIGYETRGTGPAADAVDVSELAVGVNIGFLENAHAGFAYVAGEDTGTAIEGTTTLVQRRGYDEALWGVGGYYGFGDATVGAAYWMNTKSKTGLADLEASTWEVYGKYSLAPGTVVGAIIRGDDNGEGRADSENTTFGASLGLFF